MIQELLGGAALIGGERNIPINGTTLDATLSSSLSPSPLPSPSSSTTTNTNSTTNSTSSNSENLKCPRCDSSNTKFCYYNNYNLTQPRHFCKTCRRYWTKGGALRNVPIGGGCRKNRNASLSTSIGKSSTNKMKTIASEIERSGFGTGFDHELPSNPIMWATPQNSHLLALLTAAQNPNPSLVAGKEEGSMSVSHLVSETTASTGAMNMKTLSLDPLSQVVPSIGLCSPFWKSSQQQAQPYEGNNFTVAEPQCSGLQELYQRLRSSTNYSTDGSAVVLSNLPTPMTSSPSTILEFSPNGGEFGHWNPAFSWSDFSTPNGAYP